MVTNTAFVFVKPHANTEKAREVSKKFLEEKDIKVLEEGTISGKEIDEKKLIDNHYYSIASKATILKPKELNVPAPKFKEKFDKDWSEALKEDKVVNAMDACERFGLTATELDGHWATAKKTDKLVKFGGGFYCGLVDTVEGKDPLYVMNGFFMQMRSKFVAPECSLYYYVVSWDSAKLSWEDFRGNVLGPTDPTTAPEDSLRGMFLKNWEEYGLTSIPNVGDNAVHASASPFEALCERMNWCGLNPTEDDFGALLLNLISEKALGEWKNDPQVEYGVEGSKIKKSLFDSVEDTDADKCLALLQMIAMDRPEYKQAKAENNKLRAERHEYAELERAVKCLSEQMNKASIGA